MAFSVLPILSMGTNTKDRSLFIHKQQKLRRDAQLYKHELDIRQIEQLNAKRNRESCFNEGSDIVGSCNFIEIVKNGGILDNEDLVEINECIMDFEDGELELLFDKANDNNFDIEELSKFSSDLVDMESGCELSLIKNYIVEKFGNPAQRYLALWMIFKKLQETNTKKKLQYDLSSLIKSYGNREASFLFEFFDVGTNNPTIDRSNILPISKLNSGYYLVNNIRQAIKIFSELFNHNYDDLVSSYMKIKAKQLSEVMPSNNYEGIVRLTRLYKIEFFLIQIHSIYLKVKSLDSNLQENNLYLIANDTLKIDNLLDLVEGGSISEYRFTSFWLNLGLSNLDIKQKWQFLVNSLIFVFKKLPYQLFQKHVIPDALANILAQLRAFSKYSYNQDEDIDYIFRHKNPSPSYI